MKRILVAHDGSRSSEKALKKGLDIASKFGASVTVVSVVPDLYLSELMEMDRLRIITSLAQEAKRTMAAVRKRAAGTRLKTVIRQGEPAEEILAAARAARADLIVTGSHGRHGAQRFLLGSVSSRLVDHAECSVLVVK